MSETEARAAENDALRERIDALANLAAEHMGCSGCPTPWWLVNWLTDEASARVIPPGSSAPAGGESA